MSPGRWVTRRRLPLTRTHSLVTRMVLVAFTKPTVGTACFHWFVPASEKLLLDFTPTPGVPFRVNFGVSVNQSFILVPAVGGPTTLQASDHIAISAFLADPPLNAREVPEPHATSMSLVGLSVLLAWIYATRAIQLV